MPMPLVMVFNLRRGDSLPEIARARQQAMVSIPALEINAWEVNVAPVYEPSDFRTDVTRIDVDIWEGPARTKERLQELATNLARAFQSVVGDDRRVKAVVKLYDV